VGLRRAVALAAVVFAGGCFSPDNPDCAFVCGSFNSFHCPEDYSCNRGDTASCTSNRTCYCVRKDFTGVCPFPQPDLAGASSDGGDDGGDGAAAAADMTSADTAAGADAALDLSMDMSTPDLPPAGEMGAGPDMGVAPDLTPGPDLTPVRDLAGAG
jgi:hypothetical protein